MRNTFFGSFIFTLILCVLMSVASGGTWDAVLWSWTLWVGITAFSLIMVYISGNIKSFFWVFSGKKKYEALSLGELKKVHSSVSLFLKYFFYFSIFFLMLGFIFLYFNIDEITTLGPNIGTMILSFLYFFLASATLLPVQAKIKKRMIDFMKEDDDAAAENDKKSFSIAALIKTVIYVLIITGGILLLAYANTSCMRKNMLNQQFYTGLFGFFDIISFAFLLCSVFYIAISGTLQDFVKAFSTVFLNRKISTEQKNLFVNVLDFTRKQILSIGFTGTLLGINSCLCNLEIKEALGSNMYVASLIVFYAIIVNVILLAIKAKVENLAE